MPNPLTLSLLGGKSENETQPVDVTIRKVDMSIVAMIFLIWKWTIALIFAWAVPLYLLYLLVFAFIHNDNTNDNLDLTLGDPIPLVSPSSND